MSSATRARRPWALAGEAAVCGTVAVVIVLQAALQVDRGSVREPEPDSAGVGHVGISPRAAARPIGMSTPTNLVDATMDGPSTPTLPQPGELIAADTALTIALGPHRVELLAGTRLRFERVDPGAVAERIERGAARFAVDPLKPGGRFTVHTAHLTAEVVGARFTVEVNGACSRVAVSAGHVRVTAPGTEAELVGPGQERRRCKTARPPARASSARPRPSWWTATTSPEPPP